MSEPMNPALASMLGVEARTSKPKIFLVEDEAIFVLDLTEQLEALGYEVCGTADNSTEALAGIAHHHPDLVLMDVMIKGPVDGIETALQIPASGRPPVIFLTAYSDSTTVRRAARTTPYGYLTKPLQSRELQAGVEVALYKSAIERRLKESEQWFASTLSCLADAVVAADAQGLVRFINSEAEHLLHCRLEDITGKSLAAVLRIEDARTGENLCARSDHTHAEAHNRGATEQRFGDWLVCGDGRRVNVSHSVGAIRSLNGGLLGTVRVIRDVSDRIAAERALRMSEERFKAAFDYAPAGMAMVARDGHFLRSNTAMADLLKTTVAELSTQNQMLLTHSDDRETEETKLAALRIGTETSVQFEKRYVRWDGQEKWVLASVTLLRQNESAVCYLYQVYDLTERKAAERQIAKLAHYDQLTGAANRARLMDEVDRQIAVAKRSGKPVALAMLDLDHFKQINDTLGHEAGDQLLQKVATIFLDSVRETDCVARLGGDEFVLLLTGLSDPSDAAVVMDKIRAQFNNGVTLGATLVNVGFSIGIGMYPGDGEDANALLRCADQAVYQAKAEGRNTIRFYRPELSRRLQAKVADEQTLKRALERGEFALFFQSIKPLQGQSVLDAEAQLHWSHPLRGPLSTDEFLALADDCGLTLPIGEWMIRQACSEAGRWPSLPAGETGVSVKVVSKLLKAPSFPSVVTEALRSSGMAPQRLCLEFTDNVLGGEADQHLVMLTELKRIGVRIALAGIGLGFSSLNLIGRLAPHKVKIGRAFVAQIGASRQGDAMVASMLALAHSMDLATYAEGVDTAAQAAFLTQNGCIAAQGLQTGTPMNARDFAASLANPVS